MGKRNKLWLSIQAVTLAGAATLGACSMESEGEAAHEGEGEAGAETHATMPGASPASHATVAAAGEGEAGEGEAGEGEAGEGEGGEGGEGEGGNSKADPVTSDLAYLTQLELIRGHLLAGYTLYQEGHVDHARTHMKHPKSELYADIVPAFTARGAEGFATQLEALASAVESGASSEQVSAAYNNVIAAIDASEDFVDQSSTSPAFRLKLAVTLLREAGKEYALAVTDGNVKIAHEYQDAYGFTQAAKGTVESIDNDARNARDAVAKAKAILAPLDALWPAIVPPATVAGDSSELYGAAARIELLALGLAQ